MSIQKAYPMRMVTSEGQLSTGAKNLQTLEIFALVGLYGLGKVV